MPIHVLCECRRLVVAPDHMGGSWVTCPHCGRRVDVTRQSIRPPASRTYALDGDEPFDSDSDFEAIEYELAPAVEPEPPPPTRPVELGYQADLSKRASAFWLGVFFVLVGAFAAVPAVIVVAAVQRSVEPVPTPTWVYLLILCSLLHLCYGMYVAQWADWSSVWVVTGYAIVFTALYAMLFTVCLLGLADNTLLRALELNTGTGGASRRVVWCAIMMLCNSLLAYVSARTATRWVKAYKVLSLEKVNDAP